MRNSQLAAQRWQECWKHALLTQDQDTEFLPSAFVDDPGQGQQVRIDQQSTFHGLGKIDLELLLVAGAQYVHHAAFSCKILGVADAEHKKMIEILEKGFQFSGVVDTGKQDIALSLFFT